MVLKMQQSLVFCVNCVFPCFEPSFVPGADPAGAIPTHHQLTLGINRAGNCLSINR